MVEVDFVSGSVKKSDVEVINPDETLHFPTVRGVLEKWGAKLVKDLAKSLKFSKHKASGALESSIGFTVEYDGQFLVFELSLNDYYKYLDQGVKGKTFTHPSSSNSPFKYTTKYPPLSEIGKWVGNKGIGFFDTKKTKSGKVYKKLKKIAPGKDSILSTIKTLQAVIFNRGVEGTGFYSNVVTGREEDLRKQLIDGFGKDLIMNL